MNPAANAEFADVIVVVVVPAVKKSALKNAESLIVSGGPFSNLIDAT